MKINRSSLKSDTWWNSTRRSLFTRYLSTDKAAMHPEPAAVTACLHSWSYKNKK